MSVDVVHRYGLYELDKALQRVPLQTTPTVRPYAKANRSYQRTSPELLNMSTYYVLDDHLQEMVDVLADIADAGYDPFNLEGILVYRDEAGQQFRMGPIIVEGLREEIRGEFDGRVTHAHVPTVIDGAHRFFIANLVARQDPDFRIGYSYIKGATVPFYAMPNEIGDVKIERHTPARPDRKSYRVDPNTANKVYRNVGMINDTGMRPEGTGGMEAQELMRRPDRLPDISRLVDALTRLQHRKITGEIPERKTVFRGPSGELIHLSPIDIEDDPIKLSSGVLPLAPNACERIIVHASSRIQTTLSSSNQDAITLDTQDLPDEHTTVRMEVVDSGGLSETHVFIDDVEPDGLNFGSITVKLPSEAHVTVLVDRNVSPYFDRGGVTIAVPECDVVVELGANVDLPEMRGRLRIVENLAERDSLVAEGNGTFSRFWLSGIGESIASVSGDHPHLAEHQQGAIQFSAFGVADTRSSLVANS